MQAPERRVSGIRAGRGPFGGGLGPDLEPHGKQPRFVFRQRFKSAGVDIDEDELNPRKMRLISCTEAQHLSLPLLSKLRARPQLVLILPQQAGIGNSLLSNPVRGQ